MNPHIERLIQRAAERAIHTYPMRDNLFTELPTATTPHSPDCPGCAAEAAIAALVEELNERT